MSRQFSAISFQRYRGTEDKKNRVVSGVPNGRAHMVQLLSRIESIALLWTSGRVAAGELPLTVTNFGAGAINPRMGIHAVNRGQRRRCVRGRHKPLHVSTPEQVA